MSAADAVRCAVPAVGSQSPSKPDLHRRRLDAGKALHVFVLCKGLGSVGADGQGQSRNVKVDVADSRHADAEEASMCLLMSSWERWGLMLRQRPAVTVGATCM